MAGLVNSVSSTNPNGYTSTIPGQPGYDDGGSAANALSTAKNYYATAAPAASIGSTGYTPTNWDVDSNQTVEGRINGLTNPNSALNVKAASEAAQTASSRGLINSSLAVTAGQDAVLKNALPIAQQDANTYASSAQFNAGAKNAAAQFGAGAANAASLAGASINQANYSAQLGADTSLANTASNNTTQLNTNKATNETQLAANKLTNETSAANTKASNETTLSAANLNAATTLATNKLSNETQVAIAGLDNASKAALQGVISSNSQLLQASTSAANLVTQYSTNIGAIQMSTTMDAAAKQQAVSNQLNILKASLAAIGAVSGLNLSQYFTPVETDTPATNTNGSNGGIREDYP